MLVCWADIVGFGAYQAIVADLFQDMGSPAGDATDGEGRGKEVSWQPDGGEQDGGIEFDVGIEAASWFLFL